MKSHTEVSLYLQAWLENRKPNMTPGGFRRYKLSVERMLPFFEKKDLKLKDINYDILIQLMNFLKGSGKSRKNDIDTLRACLNYAWKSQTIRYVPPFPEKKLYGITKKQINWISTQRFYKIISYIPEDHKPFFMWLYLHLRRPGEALALLKTDYDMKQDVFIIHRGISSKKEVERTKTGVVHIIPCHSEFKSYMESMKKDKSRYFFTCEGSKQPGNRYTDTIYQRIWNEACEAAGEKIDVYRGTKTSRASQLINEIGISRSDLQIAGDWSSYSSTLPYAQTNIERKRIILESKSLKSQTL